MAPESAPSTPTTPAYRTDLDGLRGIAITLVACFHVWFGKVSGGVDVFLTLSGYFFIGSLLRHAIYAQKPHLTFRDTLSPWPRLKRLLRRLLPALITVLLAVTVLTVLILPDTRWANIGHEIVASALYYQNWYLAENSQDYLAASSANSPLQHIWSMSMQGQFFVLTLVVALLFAGLLKLLAKAVRPFADPRVIKVLVFAAVLVVALGSFWWAHRGMAINQPYNYYSTISRLWEPLVGGLLAIWLPSLRVPNWVRNLATVGALGLIISCGWWIDGVNEYPGPMALFPVGATLVIIWLARPRCSGLPTAHTPPHVMPVANRALAFTWPVWLGTIAYSLYLWHWPLLIFYLTWRDKNHANFIEGVGILAVSIGLAWLTKRYIEDPLREGDRSALAHGDRQGRSRWLSYTSVVTAILVAGTVVAGVGIKLWERHVDNIVDTKNLDPRLYPGARALLEGWPVPAVNAAVGARGDPGLPRDVHRRLHQRLHRQRDPRRRLRRSQRDAHDRPGGSHAEMWIPRSTPSASATASRSTRT